MDSGGQVEGLVALTCTIRDGVERWQLRRDWHPGSGDMEDARTVRRRIAELIARLTVVDYLLGEEIAVAEKPELLAGAEG